jgi:hypothetical protein
LIDIETHCHGEREKNMMARIFDVSRDTLVPKVGPRVCFKRFRNMYILNT